MWPITAPAGILIKRLAASKVVAPAALGDQDRSHPAQGEHIVRLARQDLAIGLDRRLAAVVHDQGVGTGVPVFEIERTGPLIVRLGLVGPAEPAEARAASDAACLLNGPACQVAFRDLEGRFQIVSSVRGIGLDECPCVILVPNE